MSNETPPPNKTSSLADAESIKQIADGWSIMQFLIQREAVKKGVINKLPEADQTPKESRSSQKPPSPQESQKNWNPVTEKLILDISKATRFSPSPRIVKFFYKNQAGSSIGQRIVFWLMGTEMTREKAEQFLIDAIHDALSSFFDALKRGAKLENNQEYPVSSEQMKILRGGIQFRLGKIQNLPEGKILEDMIMQEFLDSLRKGEIFVAYNYEFETYFGFQDETMYIKHVPCRFDLKDTIVRPVKQL